MKTLNDLEVNGKRVLVRVDFNVPLNDQGHITDDRRIRAALPTIRHLLNNGAAVILISHLGRPKGVHKPELSLKPVQDRLRQLLNQEIYFVEDCRGEAPAHIAHNLHPGDVVLLENLRFHPEEKKGDEAFARELADLAHVYINDAFGTAHRAHASTTVVAGFFAEKAPGLLMAQELESAQAVLNKPAKPFVLITGGAKVSDKIGILENLLPKVDSVIVGGGMAYTFIKAKGGEIGKSLLEETRLEAARQMLDRAEQEGKAFHLPADSVVASEISAEAVTEEAPSDAIPEGKMGLDIGPMARETFTQVLTAAKTILWNGPMGVFEYKPFAGGTLAMAEAVAHSTETGAYSLIGGGDSAAAVEKAGLAHQVSYVSTGGGALLELLEGKTLPGIAALED